MIKAFSGSAKQAFAAIESIYTVRLPVIKMCRCTDVSPGFRPLHHLLRFLGCLFEDFARLLLPPNCHPTMAEGCDIHDSYYDDALRPCVLFHLLVPMWLGCTSSTRVQSCWKMHSGSHAVNHDIRPWNIGYPDRFRLRLLADLRLVEFEHATWNEVHSRLLTLHWICQFDMRFGPRSYPSELDIGCQVLQTSC